MKHILVLSNDAKTVGQISNRASELKEETAIEVFRTLAEFEFFMDPKDDPAAKGQVATDEANEQKKHSAYLQVLFKETGLHLVIVDQELLGKENPVGFIFKLKTRLLASEYHKAEIIMRFFLLSFDANAGAIDTLASVHIDDVILKPIDNQLFLQKLAMALSEKRSSAGEFIYKQEVDANIYVAQGAVIEELSDLGLVIRSKKPYKDGIILRVFSKIFGEKIDSSLLIRTYKSVPHPTLPAEFRVYYTYYGIATNQLQKIRRTLQKTQKRPPAARTLSLVELQIFKKNRKKVIVIAFSSGIRADIDSALSSNFVNVETLGFSSLISFAKKMGIHHVKEAVAPAVVTPPGQTPPNPAGVLGTLEFIGPYVQAPEPMPAFTTALYIFTLNHAEEVMGIQSRTSPFFDLTAPQMFAQSKKWLSFVHPEDRDEFNEFLDYLKTNEKGHIFIRLKGPTEHIHYIRIDAEDVKAVAIPQIKIQMTELKGAEGLKIWHTAKPEVDSNTAIKDIDAILVDASGISQPVDSWALYIKAFLEDTHILNDGKKVAIIALLPEKMVGKIDEFKKSFFSDVILTPIDRKFVIEKINFHVPGLYTDTGLMNPHFDPITADIKIAQEVKMEMASEFGIQIRSGKAIREGVFLRLFSPLFLDENYDGILARSYSSKVDDKNKSEFHNVFSFYGISDAFLKHIRKWIRDTYIAQKDTNKE